MHENHGHHIASHDDNSAGYERITRHYITQLAYLAGKLDGMSEGTGTVLDNCCLLWLSNMYSGSIHDNNHLRHHPRHRQHQPSGRQHLEKRCSETKGRRRWATTTNL